MLEQTDAYRCLADSIIAGTCVSIVGAGISMTYQIDHRAKKGYPSSQQLCEEMKKTRGYLSNAKNLSEAASLLKKHEGRLELEKYLVSKFNLHTINPLPAHECLAELNLPCYVSFNFDPLLENALKNKNNKPLVITKDLDVSFMSPSTIPVIKPHGTIERPDTLCVAKDEVFCFDKRIPIVSAFLLTWLANRNVFYLGFSISDPDFLRLLRFLKAQLGSNMPHSFAIVNSYSKRYDMLKDQFNITFLTMDATEFLMELSRWVTKSKLQLTDDIEPWMKNPFFWELIKISRLPTETQVIDSLLREVKRRISLETKIDTLAQAVAEAISFVILYRPNYAALAKTGEMLSELFRKGEDSKTRLWDEFNKLETKRRGISDSISSQATSIVSDARSILLYSQSQRVVDCLLALDPLLQDNIEIYISECRPKSPSHFQDALATARLLRDSRYRMILVPDVVALNLLKRGNIDLVLMGAHAVYISSSTGKYEYFVNTCGSAAIVELAYSAQIPIKLIFEGEKIIELIDNSQLGEISFTEEEDIAKEVIREIARDQTLSERIRLLNVGYDLIRWLDNIKPVTDKVR